MRASLVSINTDAQICTFPIVCGVARERERRERERERGGEREREIVTNMNINLYCKTQYAIPQVSHVRRMLSIYINDMIDRFPIYVSVFPMNL